MHGLFVAITSIDDMQIEMGSPRNGVACTVLPAGLGSTHALGSQAKDRNGGYEEHEIVKLPLQSIL